MLNFDYITKEDTKEHNPNWPGMADHPYTILIVGGSACGKTNALLNLINHIDKTYYAKDPYKAKYKQFINKRERTCLKYLNDSKAFIEYSNNMDGIYKNIEEYNPNMKQKLLIVFDNMIADVLDNKKLNPNVTEMFIIRRKLIISLVFITHSSLLFQKNIRLNSTHYFVMKIPNKTEIQQIGFNRSSDTEFPDVMNLFTKCNAKPCSFLLIDTTLALDNALRFRKNRLEKM